MLYFYEEPVSSSQEVINAVRPAIKQGNIPAAIQACKALSKNNKDGSTSRVVQATIRNIDRDREHIGRHCF